MIGSDCAGTSDRVAAEALSGERTLKLSAGDEEQQPCGTLRISVPESRLGGGPGAAADQ